jgi:hypothetical protein
MIVTINFEPITDPDLVIAGSVQVEDRISERSTASFDLVTTWDKHYRKGNPVEIFDDNGNLQFAGIIDSANEAVVGYGYLQHSIRLIDWHYLADKRIAARTYVGQTAGDILKDLINGFLGNEGILEDEGVTIGQIEPGETHEKMVFDYLTVAQCIQRLADLNGYWWAIRADRSIYFAPREIFTAPFTLDNNVALEDAEVENAAPLYRNTQYVRGAKDITEDHIDVHKGDGEATAFLMDFPVHEEPTVETKIGAGSYTAKTVGIGGVETGHDWYWNKGSNTIYQDNAGTKLTASDLIRVTYKGQFNLVVKTYDQASINETLETELVGSGIVEEVLDDHDVEGRESAFQIAAGELATYKNHGRTLRVSVYQEGLEAGQLITVNLPEHGIENVEMLIESVQIVDY